MSTRAITTSVCGAAVLGQVSCARWSAPSARLESLERRTLFAAAAAQAHDWDAVTIKANGFIDGIVYSPAAPDLVYIHTDMGGAYRWDAVEGKWMPLNDWSAWNDWSPQNLGVETMAVDPTDADRVYMAAGTYMSPTAILRSTDQGRTWLRTQVNAINSNGNGSARNAGERMVVDPNSPNILFYGTRDDGLWTSTNYAETWTRITSFPTIGDSSGPGNDTGIVWVQIDKSSASPGSPSQNLYAGVVTVAANKIFRSTNGGASWEAIPGQPTNTNYFPMRAAVTPDGSAMYLTYSFSTTYPGPYGITGGFVYKVTNPDSANPTWTNITPPGVGSNWGFSAVAIDPVDPQVVYVGELNNYNPADRIWRSTNGGGSWTAIQPNANRDNSSAPYVNSLGVHWLGDLQIDPFNRDVAIFTTGMGLYRTTNLNNSNPLWVFFNEGFEQSAVLELASPSSGDVHLFSAIGDRDGYRHEDFAQSPAIGRHGQNNGLARGTSDDIDVAWDDASFLVRTVRSSPWVQFSNDNGVTWQWFGSTNSAGSTSGGNFVAISADGTRAVYEPGGSGRARYATRNGLSWSTWTNPASNQPASGAKIVAELVAGSRTFYAYSGTGVSRSTDGGANWDVMTASAPPVGNWLRAVPGQAGHLVMSRGDNGVWRSIDGGTSWHQLGAGAATVANMVGVGAGPTPESYPSIYISGLVDGMPGFFRTDDEGQSWTMISDLSNQYGYPIVIQGDPRVYGRLYVGTNGRGIRVADIHAVPAMLPDGWDTQDVGAVPNAGGAGASDGGELQVIGGGAGIGAGDDAFRFAYQTLEGDGTITARVASVPLARPRLTHNGTSPANDAYVPAKAGVMIRDSLASNSSNAFVALTPGSADGAIFQARGSAGGGTNTVASVTTDVWPPYWVRLVRAGDQFTAYVSADGDAWTQLGPPQTIAMGSTAYVGLAVTSSDPAQLNVSRFQSVAIAPSDTVAPAVTASAFDYISSPNVLRFTFSEDVSQSLSEADVQITGPGGSVIATGMAYDHDTDTASFALPTPLNDGNYTAILLAAGVTDAAGNPLAADVQVEFFSLLGDANHDGTVNLADFNILAQNFGRADRDFSQGDFNYDGVVNLTDFNILAGRFGTGVEATASSSSTSGVAARLGRAGEARARLGSVLVRPAFGTTDEESERELFNLMQERT